jgi:hypothetical protein
MTRIGVAWLVLVLLGAAFAAPRAQELDVKELVRRAEDALRGNTSRDEAAHDDHHAALDARARDPQLRRSRR